MAKYVNPFTDFGFKKIFGEEASKPSLIDFLNSLLPPQSKIKDLSFKNTEHLGRSTSERKSLFDIYCEAENGEKFIVELQKAKQNFFKERTVYYSTFPIREQGEKGEWFFNLAAVFCIGILDFTFDDYETEPERSEVLHTIKLKNQHGKVFYDKLTYIYLELPNFKKQEEELTDRLDQWLYFIKNLEDFQSIPEIFKDEVIFIKAFAKAALANLDSIEYESYERSLKDYRDVKGYIDTAYDDGKKEGKMEGVLEGETKRNREVAIQMKFNGEPVEKITLYTNLSQEEINKL